MNRILRGVNHYGKNIVVMCCECAQVGKIESEDCTGEETTYTKDTTGWTFNGIGQYRCPEHSHRSTRKHE